MCEPTTIIMGVGLALSAYGMMEQNKAVAEAAAIQQNQVNDQAAQRTNQRMEEARALRASMRASAAEAAVSGNSIALLEEDIMGQAGRDAAIIEKNRQNGIVASADEARGRIRASTAEGLTNMAGAGASMYDSYQTAKYRIPGDT